MRVTMSNFVKISQMVAYRLRFFVASNRQDEAIVSSWNLQITQRPG